MILAFVCRLSFIFLFSNSEILRNVIIYSCIFSSESDGPGTFWWSFEDVLGGFPFVVPWRIHILAHSILDSSIFLALIYQLLIRILLRAVDDSVVQDKAALHIYVAIVMFHFWVAEAATATSRVAAWVAVSIDTVLSTSFTFTDIVWFCNLKPP